jgi:hypothetical protein
MSCYKIFREYKKEDDHFYATNNFYISELIDFEYIEYRKFDINDYVYQDLYEKITPYCKNKDDLHILKKKDTSSVINLISISDISFSLDDVYITKSEIIRKLFDIESDSFCDKLFKDLYYNDQFSKKINMDYPDKNNLLNEINKKYLFRITFLEKNMYFGKEKEKELV